MMPTVEYCSRANSTLFTTCCGCAICADEALCPLCKKEITPREDEYRHKAAMAKLFGHECYRDMRAEWDKKEREYQRRINQ